MLSTLGEGSIVDMQVIAGSLVIKPLTENKASINWVMLFADAIAKGCKSENERQYIETVFDKNEWT